MYNENDTNILLANHAESTNGTKHQIQKASQLTNNSTNQLQSKSLSFGNLLHQQANGHTTSSHNLANTTSPKPKQPVITNLNHSHQHFSHGEDHNQSRDG